MKKIIINDIQILDVRTGKYSSGNILIEGKKIKEISKSKILDKTAEEELTAFYNFYHGAM